MNSHLYIPFTVTTVSAAVVAAGLYLGSPAANEAVAAAAKPAAASVATAKKQSLRQYVLATAIVDGKMVYVDSDGKVNPTLVAEVGETVEITVSSGEGAEHDIVIDELDVHSAHFNAKTGPVKVTFEVTEAGTFTYYCSIPGHRQIGMFGVLEVKGSPDASAAPAKAAAKVATADQPAQGRASARPAPLPPPKAEAVSIAMSPTAVPPPVGDRAPTLVKYRIETVELEGKLDDGTTFTYWTFGRKVPGPMLRVKHGDTVELTLANAADSKAVHSIDLHAVTGGHGGGELQVPPGQERTFRFKALNPGLYVYHCATASVPHHISAGMYGMILVEPEKGLPEVDREFYVMQGDLYTTHAAGTKGHQGFSHERASDELPTYYTFNGAVGALTKEHRMEALVGETVRIYFGVGGPNKVSSFHVIGEIFDKVYAEGSLSSLKNDVQTTLVAPGGATAVELKLDYPGTFVLVDHALSRVGKGAAAMLHVSGPADSAVYQPLDAMGGMHDH
ncbi:MAG: nitrite reductase, copper-containing [Burkholderiaceae bacterium]|nr:nitrite reductase, copper-containing [Burkholderiaceae bacterium]